MSKYGLRMRSVGRSVLLCLALSLAILIARLCIATIMSPSIATALSATLLSFRRATWIFANFLLLIALPEELFYRGWLQTRLADIFRASGYRDRYAWIVAATASGAVFGASHLLNYVSPSLRLLINLTALANAVGATIVGFLLGIVRARSNCIWCPTLFHGFLDASYALLERVSSSITLALSMVVGPLIMVLALKALRYRK